MWVKDKPRTYRRVTRKEFSNVLKMKYFFVIQHLLEQQETMYKNRNHQVEDRIVSIHQPHVRPIARGKVKAKTEFGAKINIGLVNGYAKVDHFDWNAFNEGQDLQSQVERFRKLTGKYPELVQVYKIFLTWENRRFLKEKGIRHTGDIPVPYFVASLLKQIKVRIINIYSLKPQMKVCA